MVSVIRLPQVHNRNKQGLVTSLRAIAREKGFSAYVGTGEQRWAATHVRDVAHLYRLAVDAAESHPVYHAVDEEGLALRNIADAIGRNLKLPVVSIAEDEAGNQFGFFGKLVMRDLSASSLKTRQQLGWNPTGPSLIEDIENAMD